jgi:hypothetical protein
MSMIRRISTGVKSITCLIQFPDDEARFDAHAIGPEALIGRESILGLKNQETAVAWHRVDAVRSVASIERYDEFGVDERLDQFVRRRQGRV